MNQPMAEGYLGAASSRAAGPLTNCAALGGFRPAESDGRSTIDNRAFPKPPELSPTALPYRAT
jgi:hypothetical protein